MKPLWSFPRLSEALLQLQIFCRPLEPRVPFGGVGHSHHIWVLCSPQETLLPSMCPLLPPSPRPPGSPPGLFQTVRSCTAPEAHRLSADGEFGLRAAHPSAPQSLPQKLSAWSFAAP